MSISNTTASFGSVSKFLHWLTMLLMFTAIPLGVIANDLPFDTGEALAFKALLFSIHKTIGVTAFFVALIRIVWTLTQPKPGPLHPDRKAESLLAEVVHWSLYIALVIVPLSGWVHHAASSGFAPIWGPFGQSLPFVPKSESLSAIAAGLHGVFTKVLVASILLHVAGALKHHVIDKDATLRRMLPRSGTLPAVAPHHSDLRASGLAVAAYCAAIGVGALLGMYQPHGSAAAPAATLDAVQSDWTVQSGTLGITVAQFGSDVTGSFADWTADIAFSETVTQEKHGAVTVTIAIGSLTLGSVTDQALGADFFDAGQFPTATFTADILAAESGYVANGTLTLKGKTVPVTLPFDLAIDNGTATMSGTTTIARLPFGIGESYTDSSTVGLDVQIAVDLTATQ